MLYDITLNVSHRALLIDHGTNKYRDRENFIVKKK